MEDEVVVRRVEVGEADALRDVRLRALGDAPEAFGSTFEREQAFGSSVWEERCSAGATAGNTATFVAVRFGRLMGMVGGRLEDNGSAYIFGMWVDPAVRGRGVGLRLTRAVADWAARRGATGLRLNVIDGVEPAIALYRRAGFEFTGVSHTLQRDGSAEAREMVRPLD